MKLVAPHDRPREKLARVGARALGDNELLAAVLGTGTRGRHVLAVADDVLARAGGVTGLGQWGLDELSRVPGIGAPRAARVIAAIELGRRAVADASQERRQFRSAREIGHYLLPLYSAFREERFGILMLDTKLRLIRAETISIGTLDASFAHPRDVFRVAMLASAAAIVIFHNHPSGDPAPSPDDNVLTARLVAAGELMGIEVIDHMILGAGCWFSFREAGLLR